MTGQDQLEQYVENYPAGRVLFREGESGSRMYVIQAGAVDIRRQFADRERTIATLGVGEFFGEMSVVTGRPRSATAIVVEEARLLVIDGSTFESMLQQRTEIAVRMIRTMGRRLERANQQIEVLLLQNANHRVAQCVRRMAEEEREQLGAGDTGGGVYVRASIRAIAERTGLTDREVDSVLDQLARARLVLPAREAGGFDDDGIIVPEVGRLLEFLEFLELRERMRTDET